MLPRRHILLTGTAAASGVFGAPGIDSVGFALPTVIRRSDAGMVGLALALDAQPMRASGRVWQAWSKHAPLSDGKEGVGEKTRYDYYGLAV